jgi:hypothetical protein
LRVSVEYRGRSGFAIGDIVVDGMKPTNSHLVPKNDNIKDFLDSGYNTQKIKVYNGESSKVNKFIMNGIEYTQGVEFYADVVSDGQSSICFNTENVKGIKFKLGHVDDEGKEDGELCISKDGVEYEKMTLTEDMSVKEYSIDTSDTESISFFVEQQNKGGKYNTYAIADIEILADAPAVNTTSVTTTQATTTTSATTTKTATTTASATTTKSTTMSTSATTTKQSSTTSQSATTTTNKSTTTTSSKLVSSTTTTTVTTKNSSTTTTASATTSKAATTTTSATTAVTTKNSATTTTASATTTKVTTTTSTTTTLTVKPVVYILGDVDNNGIVDAVDASKVLAYYARISTKQDGGFSDGQKQAADVNKDGIIDAVDASNILSYYAYVSTTKENAVTLEEFMKKRK